ncbi:MAG: hypothetical protein H6577_07175 [Lewinellaceae bacterium]|nr:hypothetical protein [Lewinellaceae bacterium]
MEAAQKSGPDFPKNLFWDTDFDQIDWAINAPYVIERILSRGTWKDFKNMLTFYGEDMVKKVIVQFRYLDNRTLSFSSTYFNIPLEQFRCYNFKQSNQSHWEF